MFISDDENIKQKKVVEKNKKANKSKEEKEEASRIDQIYSRIEFTAF